MISVAIPSWNGKHHLEICLGALAEQETPGEAWEILVHENFSSDGTVEWLREYHPQVRLLKSERNLGFAQACNALVEAAEGDLVILLNNDTFPPSTWLVEFASAMRSAPQKVAALSGKMVDWEAKRLDFGGGVMTFDGHAFQNQQGSPLDTFQDKPNGTSLPFACGGNMIIRRQTFLEVGGFEPNFFAYFEDVDLGWRLWSAGHEVGYCSSAWVHHKGGATTINLGLYRRGFLFERNALLTVIRNYDKELWPQMLPAVLLTFQSRLQAMVSSRNPGGELLLEDPYSKRQSILEQIRTLGMKATVKRTVQRLLGLEQKGVLSDPLAVSQLRAQASLFRLLDQTMEERERIQSSRVIPDRDIFERFPLYIVPTYPGDEEFFASSGFQACLPQGVPVMRRTLEEIITVRG